MSIDERERDRPDAAAAGEGGQPEVDREEVARRAYERYEERGGAHGDDQRDWFEAEREIRERRADVRSNDARRRVEALDPDSRTD